MEELNTLDPAGPSVLDLDRGVGLQLGMQLGMQLSMQLGMQLVCD